MFYGSVVPFAVEAHGIAPRTTTVAYDANGMFPVGTTNALGHKETYVWDARFGKKTSLTGPNGRTTVWKYDGFGRKVREDRADGTFTAIDLSNAPASVTTTASGKSPVTVWYDGMGREIMSVRTGFDGTPVYRKIVYDALGRKWKEYLPYTATPGLFTQYAYDALSRPIQVTNPNGDISTTTYNGLRTVTTNARGQTTTTVKNSQGKVVSVTDAANGMMAYAYDAFGNLIRTRDAAGHITSMSYDIRGRKIAMTDPDMGRWAYAYDALGNLTRQVDAKNQVTTMAYDLLGRMIRRTEAEGTSTWIYDRQWIGALASETNGIASKAYIYDTFGRVKSVTTTVNGQAYTMGTTYDAFGRVSTITYPTGLRVQRNYNASGYLQSVSNAASGAVIWQTNTMDEFGHTLSESFGNGVTTTHVYDNVRGVLTGLQSTSGGALIQDWAYDYDALGNMLFRRDNVAGYTERFGYDNLNRVTEVRDGAGVLQKSYAYDALGNITFKSGVGNYTYDPFHPHAVLTAGNNSYAYDANGNMTGGAGRSITWTSFNKPSGISTANGYTGFSYDANHNRVLKTTPMSTTVYVGKVYEQTTLNGIVKDVSHIYAGNRLVASIEAVAGISTIKYMHGDHLGSISVITDANGAVLERLRFDVFGAPVDPATGAALAGFGATNTNRGYTGHEMDASTGLINMNARLYDPVLGRFISADTVVPAAGNMQAYNRYSYVDNNPLKYTDPTGHWKFSNLWKAVKPIVAIAAAAVIMAVTGNPMLAGFVSGFINTGNMEGAILGGISGAFFAGAGAIGEQFGTLAGIAANGVAGGMMSVAQGGNFGTGFLSAGLTKFAGGIGGGKFGITGKGFGAMFSRVTVAGVIGGVAARISGGRFWSGFQTGAFQRLFNDESHGDGYFAKTGAAIKGFFSGFVDGAKSVGTDVAKFIHHTARGAVINEERLLLAQGIAKGLGSVTVEGAVTVGEHAPRLAYEAIVESPAYIRGRVIGRVFVASVLSPIGYVALGGAIADAAYTGAPILNRILTGQ